MKRLITVIIRALASIAIAAPLFAGEGTASLAEKRSMNMPAKAATKPATPVMRTGISVNTKRAPRLEELRGRMSAAPKAAGPATRTVPNVLVPERLKQKIEQSGNARQLGGPAESSAGATAPRVPSPISGQTPAADQSIGGYDSDDNAMLLGGRIMPPDTEGDVGLEHYVQWNNLGFKIFKKEDGSLQNGPYGDPGNIFWAGTGGDCEIFNDGDPIVLYDEQAARWVFTQFLIGPGLACFAVSDGEDPTGPYTTYEFPISLAGFNDYPKMGIWTTADGSQSAYHMTTNEFGASFLGVNLTAFDRDAILAEDPAAGFQQFTLPPAGAGERFAFALQPPHLEGADLPPAGTCATYIMAFDDETWGDATGVDGYRTWEFCEDFAGGFPTLFENPFVVTSLPFDAEACGFSECVPQPNGQRLDTLSQFTMYRFAVRMLDGGLTGVISHTVDLGDIPATPGSGTAILISQPPCASDDIDTILDDAAGIAVDTVCDPTPPAIGAGPYSPTEPLTIFNGEPIADTWTLSVADGFAGDTGFLNTWCLISADIPGSPVCSSPGTAIVDGVTTFDDIVLVGAGTINDLDVSVDISHTFVGDLTVKLETDMATPGVPPGDLHGSQWAKLDLSGAPSLADTGVADGVLTDNLHRWMPSVSQDGAGNMAIVYTRSGAGPTDFPSVYYAGRESGDPAGTLQAESVCVDGSGSQVGDAARWGDYATASIDPADDCTFWVTNEFVETTGNFQWDTQICSFSFDSCGNDDDDGDGVPNNNDYCPDTVIPESVPTTRNLGRNRSALTEDAGFGVFETAPPNPRGLVFTIEDTAGCSCEQIIEAQGLGIVSTRFGCSLREMRKWIRQVNP